MNDEVKPSHQTIRMETDILLEILQRGTYKKLVPFRASKEIDSHHPTFSEQMVAEVSIFSDEEITKIKNKILKQIETL